MTNYADHDGRSRAEIVNDFIVAACISLPLLEYSNSNYHRLSATSFLPGLGMLIDRTLGGVADPKKRKVSPGLSAFFSVSI